MRVRIWQTIFYITYLPHRTKIISTPLLLVSPLLPPLSFIYFCGFYLFKWTTTRKNDWRNVWIVFQILNFECKISFWRGILFIFEKREKKIEWNAYYSYISSLSSQHHKPSAPSPTPRLPAVAVADVISKFWMLNPFTLSNTHITRPNSINVKWLDTRAHNNTRAAHIFVCVWWFAVEYTLRKPHTCGNNNKWICRYYILFFFGLRLFCVCCAMIIGKLEKRIERKGAGGANKNQWNSKNI